MMLWFSFTPANENQRSSDFGVVGGGPTFSSYWKVTPRMKFGPLPRAIISLCYVWIVFLYKIFRALRFVFFVGWLNEDSAIAQQLEMNDEIVQAQYDAAYPRDWSAYD